MSRKLNTRRDNKKKNLDRVRSVNRRNSKLKNGKTRKNMNCFQIGGLPSITSAARTRTKNGRTVNPVKQEIGMQKPINNITRKTRALDLATYSNNNNTTDLDDSIDLIDIVTDISSKVQELFNRINKLEKDCSKAYTIVNNVMKTASPSVK